MVRGNGPHEAFVGASIDEIGILPGGVGADQRDDLQASRRRIAFQAFAGVNRIRYSAIDHDAPHSSGPCRGDRLIRAGRQERLKAGLPKYMAGKQAEISIR